MHMHFAQADLTYLSPSLVITYKPIGLLYEMVMGLGVTGDGGGYSLWKSISSAKSSDGSGISQFFQNQHSLHSVYIVSCRWQSRCNFKFVDMFGMIKGLFSGPQAPAASGSTRVAPSPAPASAKVRLV